MPTNLVIDDKLIQEALIIGRHSTKKAVVTEALNEYIQRRKQKEIIKLFGTIEYDTGYDYKKQRNVKSRFWWTPVYSSWPCAGKRRQKLATKSLNLRN